MNRRGFLRFFGAMPAAAAATVVAPVTHAEVAAVASTADAAYSKAMIAELEAVSTSMDLSLTLSRIENSEALVSGLFRQADQIAASVRSMREPVARLIVAPPPKVTLVYEPTANEEDSRTLELEVEGKR